jgi:spoIIIJ-associated protein
MSDDAMPIDDQAEVAEDFVSGLVEAMGLEGEVSSKVFDDDEVVEVDVLGDELGLLVGPKGATLQAVEELTRAAVQREAGGQAVRIRVDVAGYKAKRREALAAFTRKVVDEVLESGEARALEPMGSVDRKTVHDTVNDIDGVETSSEGEDPRRYVVIRPA